MKKQLLIMLNAKGNQGQYAQQVYLQSSQQLIHIKITLCKWGGGVVYTDILTV